MGNATAKGALYRRHAAACLRMAAQTPNPRGKAELIEMARIWHNLAGDDLFDQSPEQPQVNQSPQQPQVDQLPDEPQA